MYIELGVVALPEKNIAQLHEAPAVSFVRCFSEWHRWMSFGENNAICPPFHGISSLFFPFCAGILSIRRRFFHATTFFLKVCLEKMALIMSMYIVLAVVAVTRLYSMRIDTHACL